VLRLGGNKWLFVAEKKIHKEEREMGKMRVNCQVINKKIIEGLTNIIIPCNFVGHSVSKNTMSPYDLSFLNPIRIPFVIPLVYTKKNLHPYIYGVLYYWVNFISNVVYKSYMLLYCLAFFSFFIFPL